MKLRRLRFAIALVGLAFPATAYDLNPNDLSIVAKTLDIKFGNTSDADIGPIFATDDGLLCGLSKSRTVAAFIGQFDPKEGMKTFELVDAATDVSQADSIINACAARGIRLR
jgi:hypothetical protein